MQDDLVFHFAFEMPWRIPLAALGVTPSTAYVILTGDDRLRVRFGPWKLETPLSNVTGTQTSGDYHWYKAIGPRGSFVDRGVTFGTSTSAGLCVTFREPVPALTGPRGMKHPGMTVTVENVEGLRDAIESRLALS